MVCTPAYVALVWEEQISSVVWAEKPHCLVHSCYWYHGLFIPFAIVVGLQYLQSQLPSLKLERPPLPGVCLFEVKCSQKSHWLNLKPL